MLKQNDKKKINKKLFNSRNIYLKGKLNNQLELDQLEKDKMFLISMFIVIICIISIIIMVNI